MTTYTVPQLKDAAYQAGFRGHNLVIAVAVSLAEDGARDPNALNHNSNGSTDVGAWQINSVHFGGNNAPIPTELVTLQGNADAAYTVWKSSGWSAWTTYKSGAYSSHLKTAQASGRSKPTVGTLPGDVPEGDTLQGESTSGKLLDGLTAVNDTVGVGAAVNAAEAVPKGINAIGDVFAALLSRQLWLRIGIVTVGVLLLFIGVVFMLKASGVKPPPIIPV